MSRTIKIKLGRPKLPKGQGRVVLAAQRVAPQTLAKLKQLGKIHGGVGRAIDNFCQK